MARPAGGRAALTVLATLLWGLPFWAAAGEAMAAGSSGVQLAQQSGGNQLLCDEVEQRFTVEQNALNSYRLNLLFFDAAERGCLELVERFLGLGVSIRARDRFGNTGLLLAARMGETKVMERLLAEGAEIDYQNLAGSTALLRAVTLNRRRAVKLLLEAGADPGLANRRSVTPLTAAAFNGNDRLVKMLLAAGVDPTVIDATGKAPLVYAAAKGFADVAESLLDAGLAVDSRFGNELTALMWAAGHSNEVPVAEGLATVRLLLSRGAAVDLADNRGRTALMIAAERGHAEVVAELLAAGADPAARDLEGKSALDLAADDAVRRALGG